MGLLTNSGVVSSSSRFINVSEMVCKVFCFLVGCMRTLAIV